MYRILAILIPIVVLMTFMISAGSFEELMSPLKQFKNGVAKNHIQCKQDLELVLKTNSKPYCVKESSIPELIDRGWAMDKKMQQKFLEMIVNSQQEPSQNDKTTNELNVNVKGNQQVRIGTTHTITVEASRGQAPIEGAQVFLTIEDYGEDIIRDFKGRTNSDGVFVFSWEIPEKFDDVETLLAYVGVTDGFSSKTVLFKFQVYCLPGEPSCKAEGN